MLEKLWTYFHGLFVLGIYCRTLIFYKGLLFIVSTQFIVSKVSIFSCLRIYPKVVYAFMYVTLLDLIVLGGWYNSTQHMLSLSLFTSIFYMVSKIGCLWKKEIGSCLKVISVNIFSKIRYCVSMNWTFDCPFGVHDIISSMFFVISLKAKTPHIDNN